MIAANDNTASAELHGRSGGGGLVTRLLASLINRLIARHFAHLHAQDGDA